VEASTTRVDEAGNQEPHPQLVVFSEQRQHFAGFSVALHIHPALIEPLRHQIGHPRAQIEPSHVAHAAKCRTLPAFTIWKKS
jgi:hypothetical protein